MGKKGAWAYPIPGLPKFFEYHYYLRNGPTYELPTLVDTFTGSIRIKAREKFGRKGTVGVSRDCPNFLRTPY